MTAPPNVPAEGDILAGKYRVERVLGVGGMGIVVAAMHMVLGQRVAIKLLLHSATPEVVARFLREARAAVRLKSQHVARVTDVGELPDGAPYMVMEYLEGGDLAQVVRSRGPLPVEEAVTYVLHACEGIAEAHSLGIIHRDLKPANLFLTTAADGTATVKVLDFGISKSMEDAAEGEDMQLTKTTAVLGSPLYMSPEQLRSARGVTAQSDIWSIGAILHQLVTGQVPFHTTTFADLVIMVNTYQPPPMASFRGDVPAAIDAAILRCLEKRTSARFSNVGDLAWAIAPHGPHEALASAERISRTLEAAGLTVARPAEHSRSSFQAAAPMSQRAPVSTQATMSRPAQATTQATLGSSVASTMATTTGAAPAPNRLPLVLAGTAAAGMLTALLTVFALQPTAPSPGAAADQNGAQAPAAASTGSTSTEPTVVPAATTLAPAESAGAAPAAPTGAGVAPISAGQKQPFKPASPPPPKTSAPPPPPPKPVNPLDVKPVF